jgi:putative resolvase
MNGSRTKVRRLLADPKVTAVGVEHRDRLGRMNTELVGSALAAHGRRLVVLDGGEVDDDLVRDIVEVLTSFVRACTGVGRHGTGHRKQLAAPNATLVQRRLSVAPGRMRSSRLLERKDRA